MGTKLGLCGKIFGSDFAALRSGERFCAMLEELTLSPSSLAEVPHSIDFFRGLKELLQATSRLRELYIDVDDSPLQLPKPGLFSNR